MTEECFVITLDRENFDNLGARYNVQYLADAMALLLAEAGIEGSVKHKPSGTVAYSVAPSDPEFTVKGVTGKTINIPYELLED